MAFNFIKLKKNMACYLSSLVSLSFSTNNICKNAVFSWRHPFQTKLLFKNSKLVIESAKRTFAAKAGSGKPAFCMHYFLKTNNKTAENLTTQSFCFKSKVTCKNLAHLEANKKTKQPKKSLTRLVCRCPFN